MPKKKPERPDGNKGNTAVQTKMKRSSSKSALQPSPRKSEGVILNVGGLGVATIARPFLVEFFPDHEQIQAEEIVRKSELLFLQRRATAVLRKIRKQWKREEGVGAVNVAYRTKFGMIVSPLQWVILVDVALKRDPEFLTQHKMFPFPDVFQDVPVKVREIQYVSSVAHGVSSSSETGPTATVNPLAGGAAIAPTLNPTSWGTLGICVPVVGGKLVGVTNCHVAGKKDSLVQNPAGVIPPGVTGIIGQVLEGAAITSKIDGAAIGRNSATGARPFDGRILGQTHAAGDYKFLSNKFLPGGGVIGKVFKVGAKTNFREGTVTMRRMDIDVPDLSTTTFRDVFEVTGTEPHEVTDQGDSGSVVVGRFGGKPVVLGLNFAMSKSGKHSYAIPFGTVIEKLGLQIPPTRLFAMS